jgi:hypothetical protein
VELEVDDGFVGVAQGRLAAVEQQLRVPRGVGAPFHVRGAVRLEVVVHPRHHVRAHLAPEDTNVAQVVRREQVHLYLAVRRRHSYQPRSLATRRRPHQASFPRYLSCHTQPMQLKTSNQQLYSIYSIRLHTHTHTHTLEMSCSCRAQKKCPPGSGNVIL